MAPLAAHQLQMEVFDSRHKSQHLPDQFFRQLAPNSRTHDYTWCCCFIINNGCEGASSHQVHPHH